VLAISFHIDSLFAPSRHENASSSWRRGNKNNIVGGGVGIGVGVGGCGSGDGGGGGGCLVDAVALVVVVVVMIMMIMSMPMATIIKTYVKHRQTSVISGTDGSIRNYFTTCRCCSCHTFHA
jgi:hypothetical protein